MKENKLMERWMMKMNKQFTEENILMVFKLTKRCLISLMIKELQI